MNKDLSGHAETAANRAYRALVARKAHRVKWGHRVNLAHRALLAQKGPPAH